MTEADSGCGKFYSRGQFYSRRQSTAVGTVYSSEDSLQQWGQSTAVETVYSRSRDSLHQAPPMGPKAAGQGGGGAKPTGGKEKVPKGNGQSKTNCVVCRKTTNTIVTNREGGIQCGVCDLWWHPTCANVPPERFRMIVEWTEDGLPSPWKCQACDSSMAKLLKVTNALATRVEVSEKQLTEQAGRLDRAEDKDKLQDTRLDGQDREIRQLREQVARLGDLGGPSVVREMDERGVKENNLLFHRVEEAGAGDAKMRVDHDKVAIQHLLIVMGLEMDVEKTTKVVRRVGARSSDGNGDEGREPRPLLVGFVHHHYTEAILNNSWRLAKDENPIMQAVSVVKDLTLKQRAAEREMHRLAFKKNLERSQENIDANLAFKVVGQRGSKREILAPLRDGEFISEEGVATWDRGTEATTPRWRRPARGASSSGPSSATYPNCLAVGTTGGGMGRGRGLSLGTALGPRHPAQGGHTAFGRGGGRGGGMNGPTVRDPRQRGGGGGSRGFHQVREGNGWSTVGRGGSTRPREPSGSPPGKKADNRPSPTKDLIGIPASPNKFDMLEEEEGEERDVVVEEGDKAMGSIMMKELGSMEGVENKAVGVN